MSDYSVQLETKLKAFGLTTEAAHWVMKALDPVRGGPTQIPDAIQVPTLVPEYKVTSVINAPPPGTGNWDCIVITPPSDRIGFYYATGPSGIDFSNTVATINSSVANSTLVLSPDSQLRGAPTTVAGGIWTDGTLQYRTACSSEMPESWRTSARSTTVYATGSELYNQGTVYAGQYARKRVQSCARAYDPGVGQHVVVDCAAYALPLREQDMAVMTPGFYTASAKEGVYSVNRLTGPAQEFVSMVSPTQWMSVDAANMITNLTDPTNKNLRTMSIPRIVDDAYWVLSPVLPPTSDTASSSFDDHCTWGVHIFRGLHPAMSLTVKTVTCLEIVPTSAAPSRQFIKPPMRYEPTAIAAYYALASELPSCMAAKHNFLGSILPVLSSVASKVLPFLTPLVGQGLTALGSYVSQPRAQPEKAIAPPPPTPRVKRASSVASSVRSRRVKVKVARRRRK